MQYNLSNKDESAALYIEVAKLLMSKQTVELKVATKTRTIRQNSALHVFFQLLADEFNTAGMDMRKVLKESVDIPWSADTVKEYIWKPVQKAQVQKESTTELTTKQIDEVYDVLNRYLGEKFSLHVDFPNNEREGA